MGWREGLSRLPEGMRDGVTLWLEGQIPPELLGKFLQAIFLNQLVEAFSYADETNRRAMHAWATFLNQDVPTNARCTGRDERVPFDGDVPVMGMAKLRAWHEMHEKARAGDTDPAPDGGE